LVFQRSLDDDLDREVRSHFDLLTDENVRTGMPLAEAPARPAWNSAASIK
jgi:hypothetical protein